jgi:hypothetical protein
MLPRRSPTSSFGIPITHVLQLCSEEEMVRSHTQTNIAAMQNKHAFRDRPVSKFPRDAVCCLTLPVSSSKPTVSSGIAQLRRCPEPATRLQIADDMCEETLLLTQGPLASSIAVTGTAHATGRAPVLGATRGADLQHARVCFPRAFGRVIGHRRTPETCGVVLPAELAAREPFSRVCEHTAQA